MPYLFKLEDKDNFLIQDCVPHFFILLLSGFASFLLLLPFVSLVSASLSMLGLFWLCISKLLVTNLLVCFPQGHVYFSCASLAFFPIDCFSRFLFV